MNYTIEKNGQESAYLQLYRLMVKDIIAGVYPYGTKLPSKRVIAAETNLSVITVEHALTLLNEEGYVQSRQRSGNIVIYKDEDFPGNPDEDSAAVNSLPLPVSAAFAEPQTMESDFERGDFPFSVLTKTMRRVMLDYGERILVKSPNHGCSELRSEISLYLARSRSLHIDPSRIIIGSGAEYIYGMIVQLLGTEQVYALENPSYHKILKVYEAMGAVCDMLTMTDDGIASADLERTKAKILHVTPFNSYPSGVSASISKKNEYIRWAKKNNAVLIEDNYDSELTVSRKNEEPLIALSKDADVIYINTFSGTIAPSVRVGYMILPEKMVELFNQKLGFYSCTVPIFDQLVLCELLKSGDFERHINRVRRKRRMAQGN